MSDVERMLRAAAPSALAILVRRTGDFEAAEDAMQEALLAASVQWDESPPDNPRAWLVAVAHRRYVEEVRAEVARRRRQEKVFELELPTAASAGAPDEEADDDASPDRDDSLTLFLLCCHPALTLPAQLALTLRAVGGLTTAEIARGLLVPEATVGQRISRAKARIKAAGSEFRMPAPDELGTRVSAVCAVLYLVFTEGHTASSGESLARVDLSSEAIRLARRLQAATPADAPWRGEVAGLLALMLLTEARRPARLRHAVVGGPAVLVPLAEQDRTLWDRALIAEGVALVTEALTSAPSGPYQLQAAIAAVHDEAPSTEATDWTEILGLYELLRRTAPGPMVELNWVVALAMVDGADAGLRELETVALEPALAGHFRVHAVRAHLLVMAGSTDAARAEFATAARLASNAAERRYLESRAIAG
ncbi:MAG: sigma-70 family RNA polymerase sigma factor [Leifsonia sp.]